MPAMEINSGPSWKECSERPSYSIKEFLPSMKESFFLESNGIGLTDMLTKCYRHKGRSQDQYIFPIQLNDIFALLDEYKSITTIILTSRTKVIGARGLFETYFYLNEREPPLLRTFGDNVILEGSFTLENREIEVLVPYSTSATVIEEKRATLNDLVRMYKCCFR